MNAFKKIMSVGLAVMALAWAAGASAGNVIQSAEFPGVSAQTLYDTYLSAKGHAAMTGFPANFYRPSTKMDVVVGQEGDEWGAFGVPGPDGKLKYLIGGKVLRLISGREIVMTWQAADWSEGATAAEAADMESVLILTFKKTFAGAEIQLVQVNVPDTAGKGTGNDDVTTEAEHVNTNWYFHYWLPMQKYFHAQGAASKTTP
ncbi:MAG: SRPBCC domain-containing protein [Gammaproteobacteria bacterium]